MSVGRVVVAGAAIVVLAGCGGSSSGAAKGAPTTSTPPTASTPTTASGGTGVGSSTSAAHSGGSPATDTSAAPASTTTVSTNPANALPSLQVTSPRSGQTVNLPMVVQYVVTGAASADGLSLRVAIAPDYQAEIPLTALAGSVSVPGDKMVSGLRDVAVTLLQHGAAVASARAAVAVTNLLIVGGR